MSRKTNALPDREYLLRRLAYDPTTGVLVWRRMPTDHFVDLRACKIWNTRFSGTPALAGIDAHGYRRGRMNGQSLGASRVIWKMMTGCEPDTIGHLNGVRSDNRWLNLRDGTSQQNSQNMKLFRNNTSGHVGVIFDKRRGTWRAEIKVNYRNIFLGSFGSFEDACAARQEATGRYFFGEGHGKRQALDT